MQKKKKNLVTVCCTDTTWELL